MRKTAYFMDFELGTESTAFYPRFETEILVEKAIELLSENNRLEPACNILDIGTGCGNIAISLAKYIPSSIIVALDISEDALRVARKNAAKYILENRINFIKSNLFESIKGRYGDFFDLIISNPPYITLEDFSSLTQGVKSDPYLALYGGRDGMNFYRKIVKDAPLYLNRNGILLMEIGYGQAAFIKSMLAGSGVFKDVEVYKDYSGIDRIVKANKNG